MRFTYRWIWMVVVVLLWVAPASAQTVSVTLDPHFSILGPISGGDIVYRHTWGNVLLGGQPVGTFVVREESAEHLGPGLAAYPLQAVSIAIRVTGFSGTLMMQGSGGAEPFIGNVTVVPPGPESLQGARFTVPTNPVAGVQQGLLTLTF